MCPITLLLALAIADGALQDITSVDDLLKLRFFPSRPVTDIQILEEKKDLPVFRRAGRSLKDVHTETILNGGRIATMMTELGYRAGYQAKLGTYSLRRGFGNQLDRES